MRQQSLRTVRGAGPSAVPFCAPSALDTSATSVSAAVSRLLCTHSAGEQVQLGHKLHCSKEAAQAT